MELRIGSTRLNLEKNEEKEEMEKMRRQINYKS
jgi:hypothetical protein